MDSVSSFFPSAIASRNKSSQLTPHLAEWVEGSGVSEAIARKAVTSLNDRKVIASRTGWKIYSDDNPLGWWVSGLDLTTMQPQAFGHFKPDTPIQFPDKEKPTKYISDKGHPYDAIALPHFDPEYWQRVLDDVSIPVDIDEGTKKAGAGMTCGFPSLALCGVTMWQRKGELVPNLAAVAVHGRTMRIRYDMDVLIKKEVQHEVKKLAKALEQRGCNVLVAMWNPELGLKIDDVKVNHGEEIVKKIMADAIPYAQWLKNLEAQLSDTASINGESDRKTKKPPTRREAATRLAEQYGDKWKYDNEQKTWRIWTGKCWEKAEIGAFKSLVKTTIDAKGIGYDGIEYINNVIELLQCDLRQLKWKFWDKSRYINFNNCVFDGAKAQSEPHCPGMGFTSHLPYDYKPLESDLGDSLEALRVNCPKVHKFLRTAMQGDERKMFKLLAIINALLKYRFFDLQMFVHLVGAPGSGKGKFMRFCQKLVGKSNTIACQLDKLGDGSTKASLMDKQLVVFPDERKPVGIDSILSLTGGDEISYRELYQPAASAHFYGSIMIASNKPIFIGDTTGLERRLCLVNFHNPIAVEERKYSLEQELYSEIPACIAIALSLTDDTVTQAIQGIGASRIAEYKAKEWEMKVEVSSVAAFFDAELVLDPTATTRVGKIYDAYKYFCEEGGLSKFSIVKFPRLLADILVDENLPATRHQGAQAYFEGLRLRENSDTHLTHSQVLAGIEGVEQGVTGSCEGVDEGVAPLPDKGLRELRELDPKLSTRSENDDDYLQESEERDSEEDLPPSTPSTPSTPSNPLTAGNITPSPTPPQVPQTTSKLPQTHANQRLANRLADDMREAIVEGDREKAKEIMELVEASAPQVRGFFNKSFSKEEILSIRLLKNSNSDSPSNSASEPMTTKQTRLAKGDSVEITLRSNYQGQKGEIVNIGYGVNDTTYYIQLENEKVILSVPRDEDQFTYLRKLEQ
jgi:putative DNA primase/helicase